MKKIKLIILVLSHQNHLYQKLEKCIRETWGSSIHPDVKIFYYYGGNSNLFNNDKIFCNKEDTFENIGYKTIHTFQVLLENFDFNYILRTNSSSYIDIKNCLKFLKKKPETLFYNGIIESYWKNSFIFRKHLFKFVSGSGYFLSKDVVLKIIENKEKWDHNLIDDVALGKLLNHLKVKPTKGKRININFIKNSRLIYLTRFRLNNKYYEDEILENYHFRCKGITRELDCQIMKTLHSKFIRV